jgi:hypothetical protein
MVGARFGTEQYRRAIAHELASKVYDVVVFDQYGMSWAIEDVQHLARNRPVLVHLSHDFERRVTDQIARNFSGDWIRKYLLHKNARKTPLAEEVLAHRCNLLVALTAEDSAAFNEIDQSLECMVLPPGYAGVKHPARSLNQTVPRRAILVGSFSWIAKQMNLEPAGSGDRRFHASTDRAPRCEIGSQPFLVPFTVAVSLGRLSGFCR